MTAVKKWINILNRLTMPEVPRADRHPISWVVVQHGKQQAAGRINVKDISTSGIYLLTEERWPVDDLIDIELQGEGLRELDPELHLALKAKITRHGDDGVGLSFVLPEGLELKLWEALVNYAFIATGEASVHFAFRMLRAALFLSRLCRSASEEPIAVLGGEMNEARTMRALDIVLGAEQKLRLDVNANRKRAHPRLVARILREGSWVTDGICLKLWTGILVASCGEDGSDLTNDAYVDLMIHVTPAHARILIAACSRAREQMLPGAIIPIPKIVVSKAEMVRIAESSDLGKIAMEVAYMYQYGLLADDAEISSYLPTEHFCITPSAQAMEMYRLCYSQS